MFDTLPFYYSSQPKILMEYTEFDEKELWDCMAQVATLINKPAITSSKRLLTAVKKKYEHDKYSSVSTALVGPDCLHVRVAEEEKED